jgi:uncharacterized sulfatase
MVLVATSSIVAAKPNVIIIYSDDHGYTDLGAYGIDDNVDTPHMDALARGGALMKAGYSTAPQCRPSRCGLLAGRIQNEFGFSNNKVDAGAGMGTMPHVYPAGTDMAGKPLLTVADRMKALGYVTGFSGKWHCGPNEDKQKKFDPRGRGFDDYWVAPMSTGYANLDLDGNRIPHQKKNDLPDGIANRVILQGKYAESFVKKNKDKPFFLYLPIYGPHVPMIRKSDPYYKNFPTQHYPHYNDVQNDHRRQGLALLKAMDDAVGSLVAALRRFGLEENTLILFAGDNGAPGRLSTSTNLGAWNGSDNVPMRGPKGSLHEGGIRVPMFAHWKGTIKPGLVIEEMVTTLDFTATTVAVGGGKIPDEFDGVDLTPRLTRKAAAITRNQPAFWDFYTGQAIRVGDWKLWRNAEITVLFNIAEDPSELTNLAYQQPERTKDMSKQLDAWAASLPATARYNPEGRGKSMPSSLGGPAPGMKADPRYRIPYANPKPAPYPRLVESPGGPALALREPATKPNPAAKKTGAETTATPNARSRTLFTARDANKDGAVTLKEFIGAPKGRNVPVLTERFKKLDADGNGSLSPAELGQPAGKPKKKR